MPCRTCKWLDAPVDKKGYRRVRKDNAYRCTVPVERPVLPLSVTENMGFNWPPRRTMMFYELWDMDCPMWKARDSS